MAAILYDQMRAGPKSPEANPYCFNIGKLYVKESIGKIAV